jgi:hypothetical protein
MRQLFLKLSLELSRDDHTKDYAKFHIYIYIYEFLKFSHHSNSIVNVFIIIVIGLAYQGARKLCLDSL